MLQRKLEIINHCSNREIKMKKNSNKKRIGFLKISYYKIRRYIKQKLEKKKQEWRWNNSDEYRHNRLFPYSGNLLTKYLEQIWKKGWLDSYDDNHFLIRALENRVNTFVGQEQFLYNCKTENMGNAWCENFCLNFPSRLQRMENIFSEAPIKRFVEDQLSAGKKKYDEARFFEALSEISVLSHISCRYEWTAFEYEPPASSKNKHNPEAAFKYECNDTRFVFNIEVKTARYDSSIKDNAVIPTILMEEKGINELVKFCDKHKLKYEPTHPEKLFGFIKSACDKFNKPSRDEYNLLYINWTFRNFVDYSFLEAWSLLTNSYNGLITHPDKWSCFLKPHEVMPDLSKISAIIVYCESMNGLMFNNFDYVWQRGEMGPYFRCLITDQSKKVRIQQITQMFEDKGMTQYSMFSLSPDILSSEEKKIGLLKTEIHRIISTNLL